MCRWPPAAAAAAAHSPVPPFLPPPPPRFPLLRAAPACLVKRVFLVLSTVNQALNDFETDLVPVSPMSGGWVFVAFVEAGEVIGNNFLAKVSSSFGGRTASPWSNIYVLPLQTPPCTRILFTLLRL